VEVAPLRPHGATSRRRLVIDCILALLLAMMEDPNSPYEVGIADIVRSFKDVNTFPAERIVPLTGWANATFISRDGLLLTNYHVVREQIEALDRQGGCAGVAPAAYLRAEIPRVSGNGIVGWIPVHHLDLVSNLSAADWQSGMDGALLQMRDNLPHDYLEVRQTQANVGEPIWLYGFPCATHRAPASLQRLGYEDADQSLRVSIGNVTQLSGADFLAMPTVLAATSRCGPMERCNGCCGSRPAMLVALMCRGGVAEIGGDRRVPRAGGYRLRDAGAVVAGLGNEIPATVVDRAVTQAKSDCVCCCCAGIDRWFVGDGKERHCLAGPDRSRRPDGRS
jgi:hypothetical protein